MSQASERNGTMIDGTELETKVGTVTVAEIAKHEDILRAKNWTQWILRHMESVAGKVSFIFIFLVKDLFALIYCIFMF